MRGFRVQGLGFEGVSGFRVSWLRLEDVRLRVCIASPELALHTPKFRPELLRFRVFFWGEVWFGS